MRSRGNKVKLQVICSALIVCFVITFFNSSTVYAEVGTPEVKYTDTIYDSISMVQFDGVESMQYFSVSQGDKYGVMNLDAELVVPVKYKYVGDNVYAQDDKYGMFFEDGTFIEPVSEEMLHFKDDYSKLCVDGKYGIIDDKGRIVVEPEYLDSFVYGDNQFAIKETDSDGEELWGIVDNKGNQLLRPSYTRLTKDGIGTDLGGYLHILNEKLEFQVFAQYSDAFKLSSDTIAVMDEDDKWGVIDTKGKVIAVPQYDSIEIFSEYGFEGIYRIVLKNKYGFMNQKGEILVEPVFYEPSSGEYRAGYMTGDVYMDDAKVGSEYKKGLVSTQGKLLLKPEYDDIVAHWYSFNNSIYIAGLKDNVWKLYTTDGKFVINVEKGYQVEVIRCKTVYVTKDNKRYLLDVKTGKHRKDTEFTDYADPMESILIAGGKYSLISNNDKIGMVNNRTGKIVIKLQYNYIDAILFDGANYPENFEEVSDKGFAVIAADKNNKCSLFDTTGKLLVKTDYVNIYDFVNGYAAVVSNGKLGFINRKYKLVVPIKYESAGSSSEDLFPVKTNGKWGFADEKGKIVIKPAYDAEEGFKDGLARVKIGTKYGFIDTKGKVVVKIEFEDTVGSFTNGLSPVVKDGKLGVIDKKGNLTLKTSVKAEENTRLLEMKNIDGSKNPVSVFQVRYKEKYGLCIIK